MGRSPDKNVKKINLKHALDLDRRGLLDRHFNLPPAKDTIAVPNNGYVVFRFRADNPGEYKNNYNNASKTVRKKKEIQLLTISFQVIGCSIVISCSTS